MPKIINDAQLTIPGGNAIADNQNCVSARERELLMQDYQLIERLVPEPRTLMQIQQGTTTTRVVAT
jgi:catalase